MESNIPKQFLLLDKEPIVMTTIKNIYNINNNHKIILVLNKEDLDYWQKIKEEYSFSIPVTVVIGGKERYNSVKNALNSINENDDVVVAIHDGVRPFVTKEMFDNCFKKASIYGNAICCIPISESVRYINEDGSNHTLDRKNIRIIQTPQCFKINVIKRAYEQEYKETFTDDSAYVENLGEKIYFVDGDKRNIKITYPTDLIIAKEFLKEKEI